MDKVKWGIVSTGNIAHQFAADFQYVTKAELVAVASRTKEKAEEFACQHKIVRAYGSYEDLYLDSQVDAIYVATPHNFHLQNSSDAMRAGKAVLCEKPITVNPGELSSLIKISQTTGQYLVEGMWTYFLPAIKKAREWVDHGRIGTIKHVKSDFGYPAAFNPKGRLYNPELAGGSLLDIGIYPIAFTWLFLQKNPVKMSVILQKASTGVDDDVNMLFEYQDVTASLHSSFQCKLHNHAYIIGDQGYIMIPDFWRAYDCFLYQGDELKDQFHDDRQSVGFEFEIEEVSTDLLGGRKESHVVPLDVSMKFQEHMNEVRSTFD